MDVGENIRRIRKSKRITMKELGKKVGISEQGIGNYERGDRRPNLNMLNKIADALCTSLEELLTDTKRSFSCKLITAISEMNYVHISGDFSEFTESDESIRYLETISKEANIALDSLQECLDENIELSEDDQIKLIHFWSGYRSSEDGADFEAFMNTNHRYIITNPAIAKEIKIILKKESAKDNFEKLLDLLDENGFEISVSNKNGKNEINIFNDKINIAAALESDLADVYDIITNRINSYSKFIIEEELKKFIK